MAHYVRRAYPVWAITFDELVEYGKKNGGNIVNGMPWSFKYQGVPVSHENDDCYIINNPQRTMHFHRGDMLVTDITGTFPCSPEDFARDYEQHEQLHQ